MKKKKKALIKEKNGCFFCQKDLEPNYKEPKILQRFIRDTGKINNRKFTGCCAKHQRRLAREIKKARFLALLPFTQQI